MHPPTQTDAMLQFTWHANVICAIAALTVIFNAADPNNDAAAMVLLTAAALIRWSGIETLRGDNAGLLSGILLDAGLGLMAANTIAFWT